MIDNRLNDPNDADAEHDSELGRVMRQWQAPEVSEALDARVLASYRRVTQPAAWWRWFFAASVRVPLPVALAAVVLLFVLAAVSLRPHGVPVPAPPQSGGAGSMQAARVVEQPVVIKTSLAGFEPVSEVNVSVVSERRQ